MKKKEKISLIVFIIGLVVLATGVIFLIINLVGKPGLQDGEFLVSAEEWVLEGEQMKCSDVGEEAQTKCLDAASDSSVIWKFTEIGKGTLTTNNHLNDYDFIWALEDGKLKIETDWLYKLENEYDYSLNQNDGVLILKNGEDEYKFFGKF